MAEPIIESYFREIDRLVNLRVQPEGREDMKADLHLLLVEFQNELVRDIKGSVLRDIQRALEKNGIEAPKTQNPYLD